MDDPRHNRHLLQRDPFGAFDQLVRDEEEDVDDGRGIAGEEIFHRELTGDEDGKAAAEKDKGSSAETVLAEVRLEWGSPW